MSNSKTLTDDESVMEDWRNNLIRQNEQLVYYCYQRYIRKTSFVMRNKDDIINAGFIGLVKAAERYDSKLGVKFSTYAIINIYSHMINYLRDNRTFFYNTTILEDFIPAPIDDKIDDEIVLCEVIEYLHKTLNEQHYKIFQMWLNGMTQSEIGENLGCSRQHISSVIRKILEKVKRRFGE